MDEKDVQTGDVSTEAPSTEVEAQPTPPSQPAPTPTLTLEEVQRMVNEGIERAKQSARDSARAEVERAQRGAMQAKVLSDAAIRQLEQADPDAAVRLRKANLDVEEHQRRQESQQEQLRSQHEEWNNWFWNTMAGTLSEMGIDPKEPGLDLGLNAANYQEAQERILRSAASIVKTRQKGHQAAQEELARIKRDANSVNTTVSGGGSSGGIPTDLGKFKEWITSVSQEDYEKTYASKVREMMRQGKIK